MAFCRFGAQGKAASPGLPALNIHRIGAVGATDEGWRVGIYVGVPPTPAQIFGFSLLSGRKSLAGSSIGGLPETQEMLDYCAEHNIVSDVEVISIPDINKANERMLKGDVHYRFVIDMATL